jgi:hypothetical protein
MNKFKPLFDIPLAKYDTLEEYPSPEEVKRALEAHLVNHTEIPKKLTVDKSTPSQATAALANTNIVKPSRKRKREEKKPTGDSLSSSKPKCPDCGKRHGGDCWVTHPELMPQHVRDSIAKRQKTSDSISR